jgi:hypothetical protein
MSYQDRYHWLGMKYRVIGTIAVFRPGHRGFINQLYNITDNILLIEIAGPQPITVELKNEVDREGKN